MIDRVPYVPVPVAKIVEIMGAPDSHVGNSHTFISKEHEKQTDFLYLEVNKEEKVTGWKLDHIS